MSRSVAFGRKARQDMTDAIRWYDAQREGLGDVFADSVDVVLRAISSDPERQPIVVSDVRKARVRRFPYAVYYRVKPRRIDVIAVVHGKRDPNIWKSRV